MMQEWLWMGDELSLLLNQHRPVVRSVSGPNMTENFMAQHRGVNKVRRGLFRCFNFAAARGQRDYGGC
jgi:hypothetical protein